MEYPVYGAFLDGENIHQMKKARARSDFDGKMSQGLFQVTWKIFVTKKVTIPGFWSSRVPLNVADRPQRSISDNLKDYFLDFSSNPDRCWAPSRINVFLLAFIFTIFLGCYFPLLDLQGLWFPWKIIINIGYGLVSFFMGKNLIAAQLRVGLKKKTGNSFIKSNWLPFFIPALVWVGLKFSPWIPADFRLGISYLSCIAFHGKCFLWMSPC